MTCLGNYVDSCPFPSWNRVGGIFFHVSLGVLFIGPHCLMIFTIFGFRNVRQILTIILDSNTWFN